jgi:hypothetical protein
MSMLGDMLRVMLHFLLVLLVLGPLILLELFGPSSEQVANWRKSGGHKQWIASLRRLIVKR